MSFIRKFKWGPDEEFGGEGWIPTWIENANAVGMGFTLAHDSLEHFPNCINGFEGEMLAFGQMLFVRIESGYAYKGRQYVSPEDSMSYDIANFINNWWFDGCEDPGPVPECSEGMPDETFDEIARKGVLYWVTEYQRDMLSETINTYREIGGKQLAPRIAGWMRLGYMRARRRFEKYGLNCWHASELFRSIAEQFDEGNFNDGTEGDELHVKIDLAKREASVYTVRGDYAYD